MSPIPTDIGELIRSRSNILQRLLGETVVLTHHIDTEIWPAMVDEHRFEDTLLNLVINAREAMTNGGELHLRVENSSVDRLESELIDNLEAGSFVLLTVTDTGAGIKPELLSRVIDPFFTTKKFGDGSGLGLSMAYGFAKQSGGHLAIDSNQGESTTVRLYLPRAAKTPQKSKAPVTVEKYSQRTACRVLVVEDDPSVLNILSNMLVTNGYIVSAAMNGHEALATLEEEGPFDILISDIVLPGDISGFDIQREANLLQPGIASILTTGYSELTDTDERLLIEGADTLYKPYTNKDLLTKIELTLNKKIA